MENLIRLMRKLLKLDSESMLNGGARLNHFWQAEHRNVVQNDKW